MPHYMRSIVSVDRENRQYQVVVLFDDDDINSVVCQHSFGLMPSGHQYDPEKVYVTDEEIDRELARMGFRVVGGAAGGVWGERIVTRADSEHTFFDPATREWHTGNPIKRSE